MQHLASSVFRTLIQALLLMLIYRAFLSNADILRTQCKTCAHIASWFEYTANAYFVLSIGVLLMISAVAKQAFDRHILNPQNSNGTTATAVLVNGDIWTFINDLASVAFFVLLAIGVVLTDGVLESALAGLLTVSVIYSTTRLVPTGTSRRFRALEIVAVVLIVVSGELALAFNFGSTADYREAASIFDGSTPTKILGYSTFTLAISVIIAENWKLLLDAIKGS